MGYTVDVEGEIFMYYRFNVDGEQKYLAEVQELIRPERNTLTVSFEDVEKYNQQLATTVLEEYYRYSKERCISNSFYVSCRFNLN